MSLENPLQRQPPLGEVREHTFRGFGRRARRACVEVQHRIDDRGASGERAGDDVGERRARGVEEVRQQRFQHRVIATDMRHHFQTRSYWAHRPPSDLRLRTSIPGSIDSVRMPRSARSSASAATRAPLSMSLRDFVLDRGRMALRPAADAESFGVLAAHGVVHGGPAQQDVGAGARGANRAREPQHGVVLFFERGPVRRFDDLQYAHGRAPNGWE